VDKRKTSLYLTKSSIDVSKQLSQKWGLSQSAVVELAIRKLNEWDKVPIKVLENIPQSEVPLKTQLDRRLKNKEITQQEYYQERGKLVNKGLW
jgi:hypothetical protein